MRVLITGSQGYIGSVLAPLLRDAGHECVGLDAGFFADCAVAATDDVPVRRLDLRDVVTEDLEGFEAVIHLAGLSNDPLGSLNPALTYQINFGGSVRLAEAAREVGTARFVFASSCSLYGGSGGAPVDESGILAPLTPYAETKALFEAELMSMASPQFAPVILRNATAHGWSPRLRGDLVVHSLLSSAITTGQALIKSDGSPWRPLVHVEDISRAMQAAIEAPVEDVHSQILNVGSDEENYQIGQIAEAVAAVVPGSVVRYAPGGEPDSRDYRVDFGRIRQVLPRFRPVWSLARSLAHLREKFLTHGIDIETLEGPTCTRLERLRSLISAQDLDHNLRWSQRVDAALS